MFQVVSFGKEHLHNIKSNSTNEINTKVTKQTNVKENVGKGKWLIEDVWQATTNYKLKKERNTNTKQRNPLGC